MKKFWIAFTIGALAGGVAVLLYTPHSGPSTRRKLKHGLEDIGDNLSDVADYLKEQAERLGKEAQKLVDGSKGSLAGTMGSTQDFLKQASGKVTEKASRLM